MFSLKDSLLISLFCVYRTILFPSCIRSVFFNLYLSIYMYMFIWLWSALIFQIHTLLVRSNKSRFIPASSIPFLSHCQDIGWQIELHFEHTTGHLSKTSQKSSLCMFMKDISKLFLTWNVYIQSLRCEHFKCHQNHLAPGV